MMQKSIVTLIATLAIIILTGAPVKANFLGLAPGDYTITLLDTTGFCTTNCTGTVHIGSPGATGFDWSFILPNVSLGSGNFFFFDTPNLTSLSPNGLNSCAVDSSDVISSCAATDSTIVIVGAGEFQQFLALSDFGGSDFFSFTFSISFLNTDGSVTTELVTSSSRWTAEPLAIPEPGSLALLSFGALGLYLRRRRQNR